MGLLLSNLHVERRGVLWRHDAATAAKTAGKFIDAMRAGSIVALCSDAGTPAISDPGSLLIKRAVESGLRVSALPGACAATVALSCAGFDTTDGFVFFGFLPGRGTSAKRRAHVQRAADEARPCVLYESPLRIHQTLTDLAVLGDPDRECLIARELTKTHEELWRGSVTDAVNWINGGSVENDGIRSQSGDTQPRAKKSPPITSSPRGEFTLVLDRRPKKTKSLQLFSATEPTDTADLVAFYREKEGLSLAAASRQVALDLGLRKSDVYRKAMNKKTQERPPPGTIVPQTTDDDDAVDG